MIDDRSGASAPSGGPPGLAEVAAALGPLRGRGLALVGIGGRGCAGTSTLAHALEDVVVVATDAFWDGEGFDLARLRVEVLEPLLEGRVAEFDGWDWAARRPSGARRVEPEGVVVVEGVCALHRTLRDAYDLRVWVETPVDERLRRAELRDGPGAADVRRAVWEPREDRYVASDRPLEAAQLVVPGHAAT